MVQSKTKTGRPVAVYRTSWGIQVPGLLRLKDGRWRLSGKEKTTFTEPDERLAVAKFRKLEAERQGGEQIQLPVGSAPVDAIGPVLKKATQNRLVIRIPREPAGEVAVARSFDSDEIWAWVREQILTRPQYVAQRVGVEQIGWLTDIKRPTVSPKLIELGELYSERPNLSTGERSRSRLHWKEFIKAVGVETVRQLDHDCIVRYEKIVMGSGYAPKSVLHRFRKIRTVLGYAIKRGQAVEDCRKALDLTKMLEVKNAHPLDPKPIDPADFWTIQKAALKAGDEMFATLMLVAVNAAMYGGEASALMWKEIDLSNGELVTRRPKTKVSRVAILWPETIAALKKLPRLGDEIFHTSRRSYTNDSVHDSWRKHRAAAGLGDDLVFSQIRDSSFTLACRISLDQARVLAGHRLPGQTDFYVRRNPAFVGDACKAIRKAFYAK